jgi:NAD(P)-dependent dehydrogenase (short-subunit alcohol dehydrogenase family)
MGAIGVCADVTLSVTLRSFLRWACCLRKTVHWIVAAHRPCALLTGKLPDPIRVVSPIREQNRSCMALKRYAQPAEIAAAAAFLASADAGHITGHVLNVDGGFAAVLFDASDER